MNRMPEGVGVDHISPFNETVFPKLKPCFLLALPAGTLCQRFSRLQAATRQRPNIPPLWLANHENLAFETSK